MPLPEALPQVPPALRAAARRGLRSLRQLPRVRLSVVRKPESSDDLDDAVNHAKLARAVIDDALAAIVGENIARCESAEAGAKAQIDGARRDLQRARAELDAWRRHGMFNHVVGVRALMMAQMADLADTRLPAGVHVRAVADYLAKHHPPNGRD